MNVAVKVFAITRAECRKKVPKCIEGRSLVLEALSKSVVSKMVADDQPTFFAMNANKFGIIFRILSRLTGKTHINTKALPRTRSFLGGAGTRSLGLFRTDAGGAAF